ncbi:MAG TPA: hypothetical protein VKB53_00495 [Gammaproteobacteria bacterium]|nr:hypothetical protein [Gammaproteobacteria bacterium]
MPWQKGQSGNPGGTSKGCGRKLTDAFIRALARDWKAHGEKVDQRQCRFTVNNGVKANCNGAGDHVLSA